MSSRGVPCELILKNEVSATSGDPCTHCRVSARVNSLRVPLAKDIGWRSLYIDMILQG